MLCVGEGSCVEEESYAGCLRDAYAAYGNEKIISLADIAMYTDDAEVPLYDVLEAMKKKENTAVTSIDPKKATPEQLREYLGEVLPNFDREYFRGKLFSVNVLNVF